jgi:endonuclease/exonuclease/phosphatase family metal-dependent hydrolase
MTPRFLAPALAAAVLAQTPERDFLRKPTPDAVRVMAWNIGNDSIFPAALQRVDAAGTGRPAQFARVIRAVQPDVSCLGEVRVDTARVAALFKEIQPVPGITDGWRTHAELDAVIVTRFGIRGRSGGSVNDGARRRGHAIALLELPGFENGVYMVCAHFDSGGEPNNVAMRERQADLIVNAIREAKIGRGDVPVRPRTPFVILGDLNAIAQSPEFVENMLAGRLTGAAPGGPGLDWDGSRITDARPRQNGTSAEVYTWRWDVEPYPPGPLDRVFYSDSTLRVVNSFVLNTTTMSYEELRRAGVRATDVMRDPQAGFHDHLPIVVDFVPR